MFTWNGSFDEPATEKIKDDSSVFEDIEAKLDAESQARAIVRDTNYDRSATLHHRRGGGGGQGTSSIETELNMLLQEQAANSYMANTGDDHGEILSVTPSTTSSYYSHYSEASSSFSASQTFKKRRRKRKQKNNNSILSEYQNYLRRNDPAGVLRKWVLQCVHMPRQRRELLLAVGVLACVCLMMIALLSSSQENRVGPRKLNVVESKNVLESPPLSTSSLQMQRDDYPDNMSAKEALEIDSGAASVRVVGSESRDGLVKASAAITLQYSHGKHEDYLPKHLRETFADVWDLPFQRTDRPYYFRIPKSGGTVVAAILTNCLRLVSASSIGATEGHGSEPMLEVNTYKDQGKYVNVDTFSSEGLQRAQQLGLVQSGLADIIMTNRFIEGAALFDQNHRARAFVILRNPIRRAISMFYYLQRATWEPTYDPSLVNMTLKSYATSGRVEENWVTRFLTHEYTDRLSDQHVELAKEILRRKMVVGLLEKLEESMKRLQLYFGWWDDIVKKEPQRCIVCQQRRITASHTKGNHPDPPESDPGFQALARLNWADMEVYDYAVKLFEEQAALVAGKSSSLVGEEQERPKRQDSNTLPAPAMPAASSSSAVENSLIPATLKNIADINTPYDPTTETPLFWHLSKSGGTSIKHMYSDCYELVEACENGVTEGYGKEPTLQTVQLENNWRVVNVDTTLEAGIDRAAKLNLIPSRQADLIVTPLLQSSATKLFSPQHKGRLFTIFRDPIERVVSLFYYLQKADWEPTFNPALRNMTLEQYAYSSLLESNFVTRLLLDKMEAPLEERDFDRLKAILRTKCLVGLLGDGLLEESVKRFDRYFGFSPVKSECMPGYLKEGTNRLSHPKVPEKDSLAYKEMARKNHMDLRLYEYVKQLFAEQASLVEDIGSVASSK